MCHFLNYKPSLLGFLTVLQCKKLKGKWMFVKCLWRRCLWVRFFKKIQDWILKSERIRKGIFRFFTKQINPRSLGPWCFKETEESTLKIDSSVPLTHHDPSDLGLIHLIKKHKILFRILSDSFGFKNPILDFLKETHPLCPGMWVTNWQPAWNRWAAILNNLSKQGPAGLFKAQLRRG